MTLKLLPEHADPTQKLSFMQRTHSLFHRSSIPVFRFVLHVTLPNVIQLDHPDQVPVLISAEPVAFDLSPGESSSTAVNSSTDSKSTPMSPPSSSMPPPQITLARFSLSISALTCSRAKSVGFFNYHVN